MNTTLFKKHTYHVLAAVFILMALVLFAGAAHTQKDQVGRYRMSVTIRNNFTDIFVIDTTTGVVKYVGKDEGKPFEQIKGK
jgi:hypothetical protein